MATRTLQHGYEFGPTFNYLLDAIRSRPLTSLVDEHVDVANRLKAHALEDQAQTACITVAVSFHLGSRSVRLSASSASGSPNASHCTWLAAAYSSKVTTRRATIPRP